MFGVLFSRDRALQLDATLRSFLIHMKDTDLLPLAVLYKTSTPIHEQQYQQLSQEYSTFPNIDFVQQTDFRENLLQILLPLPENSLHKAVLTRLPKLGQRIGRLATPILPSSQQTVLFLVDDNLFVNDFSLIEIEQAIQQNPDTLGFSLRLGANTHYCYPLDREQKIPEFSPIKDRIRQYRWRDAEFDFHYPLEVSSSVYRLEDMLPILLGMRFHNPNTLEMRMEKKAERFQTSRPCMFCYDRSVTFCNPINKIQTIYNNRSAERPDYTTEALAQKFTAGYRIDVEAYRGMVPNACHQEVELVLKKRVEL